MIASEARRPPGVRWRQVAPGGARCAYGGPSNSIFAGGQSRESCGTWQLPQITFTIAIRDLAKKCFCACFLFCFFGFGGPGGGFGGFQVSSKSSGKATTGTTKKKATTRSTKTTPRTTDK